MGYELSVSEVGPAEYPLMQVLRETIFGEVGHVSHTTLAEDLDGRRDVFALIAHLEGNPIGYKVGYRFGPGVYYSKSGGVLKEYRRNGLARQMQTWQHGWARARGYRQVVFNSFNHFKDMIRFGLDTGFVPVGAERQSTGDLSFKFVRDLSLPDPPKSLKPSAAETARVDAATADASQHGLIAAMASIVGNGSEGDIEEEIHAPGATATIAFLGGKPVGFALVQRDRESFRTTRFCVVDTYQGRGAEAALARHQVEIARSGGSRYILWEVGHDQVQSLKASLDAGYHFAGLRHDATTRQTRILLEHWS